ncbi:hypothetical protein BH09PAT3_BH09PAT3_2690 [soil metagenome]
MSVKTGEAWVTSKQKRLNDIVFAGMLAPLLLPIAAVSAGAIIATERESPVFTQRRHGRGGSMITIGKLRTMPRGTAETMSNGHYDERRTKLGRILSLTRIDEVPQLINVLHGDMSMVGLRPLVHTHYESFMDNLAPATQVKVAKAYDINRPGWFDPYAIDMYVHGLEGSSEARAESVLRYTFEEASAKRDAQIMFQALGVVKHIVGATVESTASICPVVEPEGPAA